MWQDAAMKFGAWQMVLWQPRWLYAEVDGLCYQKISTSEVRSRPRMALVSAAQTASGVHAQKPIGRPKKILFKNIKDIDELDCAEARAPLPRLCAASPGL
jgi:hypothetical protein